MIPLFQSRYDPSYPYDSGPSYEPYGGVGLAVNLLCGIAAAVIVSRKGYSSWQVVLHALFGVFCCGIGSLISALLATDLTLEQRLRDAAHASREMKMQEWRETVKARSDEEVDAFRPRLLTSEPGQIRCPRCGTMNAAELASCWHCSLSFHQTVDVPEADEDDPLRQMWKARRAKREREKVREFEELTKESSGAIRIQCNACGKRFSGPTTRVQSITACPKCGIEPFDYKVLPS